MPKRKRYGVKDERNGTIFGPWASKHAAASYAFGRNQSTRGKPFKPCEYPEGRGPNLTPGAATRESL